MAPLKNCTLATVPGAVSLAVAVMVTLPGARKPVLFIGVVMLTVGGTLFPDTVTLIGAEVVAKPPLSVALAVRMYGVALAATFAKVKLYVEVCQCQPPLRQPGILPSSLFPAQCRQRWQ